MMEKWTCSCALRRGYRESLMEISDVSFCQLAVEAPSEIVLEHTYKLKQAIQTLATVVNDDTRKILHEMLQS